MFATNPVPVHVVRPQLPLGSSSNLCMHYGDDWIRHGPGRSIWLEITDVEMRRFLQNSLPTRYGPYKLIGTLVKKVPNGYGECFVQRDLHDFLDFEALDVWDIFINSESISEFNNFDEAALSSRLLVACGLINLHRPHGKIRNFSLSIVHKIRNKLTGEIVEHEEYNAIYSSLLKALENR